MRDDADHPGAARRDDDERAVARHHLYPRVEATGEHHGVLLRVAAQAMQVRAAVVAAPGRGYASGRIAVAMVDEGAVVLQPTDVPEAHATDRVGECSRALDVQHVERAVLGAAAREAIGDVATVRRGHVPVNRGGRFARHTGGVEQHTLYSVGPVTNDQQGCLSTGVAAQVEGAPAGQSKIGEQGRVSAQHADVCAQSVPLRQGMEELSRIGRLGVEPGACLLALPCLHPAIGVVNGDTEVGVADGLDTRCRRSHA